MNLCLCILSYAQLVTIMNLLWKKEESDNYHKRNLSSIITSIMSHTITWSTVTPIIHTKTPPLYMKGKNILFLLDFPCLPWSPLCLVAIILILPNVLTSYTLRNTLVMNIDRFSFYPFRIYLTSTSQQNQKPHERLSM